MNWQISNLFHGQLFPLSVRGPGPGLPWLKFPVY